MISTTQNKKHFFPKIYVTIHPFDDGNGRMTRAITDMLLAGITPDSLLLTGRGREPVTPKSGQR